jgi:hypothetical protein
MLETRTWPYGTVKQVTVFAFNRCYHQGKRCTILAVTAEDDKEAYLMVNGPDEPTRKKGDRGTITFTQGGPTGGYWKFTPDAQA